ncbi:C6 transcription factor [Seiridium cupressi]
MATTDGQKPKKRFFLNFFDHGCKGSHIGDGDKGTSKDTLEYWVNLARLAEKGKISFIFLADSYNTHDVYGDSTDAMLRAGAHTATLDPFTIVAAMAALEQKLSIIPGRPFAISDRDIDIQLPLDVEESCEDVIVLERAKVTDSQAPRAPATESTSITGFKYICQLRQIESDIQQSIYRVDQCQPAIKAETERILKVLEQWKESMPRDASHAHPESPVVDKLDFYSVPVGFSVMALHSIFLAGLTLLYCAWASPKKVLNISTSNDMNACSIVLYIVAERWPGARKHRDLYESIKQVVLESIEEGKYEPRRAITSLGSDIRSGVRGINDIDGYEELTAYAMVNEMAGSPITSDAVTPQDRDSNCVADTPGTRLNPNKALPMDGTQLGYLELHLSLDTMFATHSNDWMMP